MHFKHVFGPKIIGAFRQKLFENQMLHCKTVPYLNENLPRGSKNYEVCVHLRNFKIRNDEHRC